MYYKDMVNPAHSCWSLSKTFLFNFEAWYQIEDCQKKYCLCEVFSSSTQRA